MSTQNFSYNFTTSKFPEEVFKTLINPQKWWIGLHNETITGNSEKLDNELLSAQEMGRTIPFKN